MFQMETVAAGCLRRMTVLAPAAGKGFHALAQLARSFPRHGSLALKTPLLRREDPRVVQGDFLRFAD